MKSGITVSEDLRNAVVLQAVEDWRNAMIRLRNRPGNLRADAIRRDCEHFFASRWFSVWTQLDGEELLKKLKETYSARDRIAGLAAESSTDTK